MQPNQGNIIAETTREGATTYARVFPSAGSMAASLCLTGHGQTTLSPKDHDVPAIGEAIAIGRAVEDLGKQLAEAWQERVMTKVDYDLRQIARGRPTKYHTQPEPDDDILEEFYAALGKAYLQDIANIMQVSVPEGASPPVPAKSNDIEGLVEEIAQEIETAKASGVPNDTIPGRDGDSIALIEIQGGVFLPVAVRPDDAPWLNQFLNQHGQEVATEPRTI